MNAKGFIQLVIVSLLMLSGCEKESPTVKFIIPKGFEGIFLVSKDEVNGQMVDKEKNMINLNISRDGHLLLKDISFISSWHKVKAEFDDGTEISYYSENPDAEYSLFNLGFMPETGSFYLVGNQAQYENVSKQQDLSKLPLGQRRQKR